MVARTKKYCLMFFVFYVIHIILPSVLLFFIEISREYMGSIHTQVFKGTWLMKKYVSIFNVVSYMRNSDEHKEEGINIQEYEK